MNNLTERIGDLSPQKRALLEIQLRKIPGLINKDALLSFRIEPVNRTGDLPLSCAQERLWILDQLEPGNVAYNVPGGIRIRGELKEEVSERALGEIVRRHEILRTRFEPRRNGPVQVIEPVRGVSVQKMNLSELPFDEREKQIRELITAETHHRFHLAAGPLLRISLLKLQEREHVLLLTLHHIVADGWSVGVLIREFIQLYEAFAVGKDSPLAELPVQYGDYAAWQRGWLEGEMKEKQLKYWRGQLEGVEPLELSADRPRLAEQSFRGSTHSFCLSLELMQGLKALSRAEGMTLFMVLSAAFKVLLYRHTGQDDVAVGVPMANRNLKEIEGLIGFFVNTLVLRTDLSGAPKFKELLRRERDVVLGAYEHQELPFEKIVQELRPNRKLGGNPLFNIMFALQNTPQEALKIDGFELDYLWADRVATKFELTVTLTETAEGLRGLAEYSADIFEADSIARLMRRWEKMLTAIVENPDRKISELEILAPEDEHQLQTLWNGGRAEQTQNKCIHELFERLTEERPEATAVVYQEQQLTYRELNAAANRLAHHLRKLGVVPETLVGICAERGLEMVVGLLAILKAGGAYLPLDPQYPRERLKFMMDDSRLELVIATPRVGERLPEHKAKVVWLDSPSQACRMESEQNPVNRNLPQHLAYVIYTSGSTGQPKGVQVSHRNLVHSTEVRLKYYENDRDKFLLLPSFAFDSSVAGIFGTLCGGGELILPNEDEQKDPKRLGELLIERAVTSLLCIPSFYKAILTENPRWVSPALTKVILAGEACSRDVPQLHLARMPGADLYNEYGPTEGTVWSTVCKVPHCEVPGSIPIGRPIANSRVYILDRFLNPAPVGVPGELYIGGDGVARGYLNRPELTAEKFVPDPFGPDPGGQLYRTGDIGRYLPDGQIEFLGRSDRQIKLRGWRIELEEIESVLNGHQAVKQSAVLVREKDGRKECLVGYVVWKDAPIPIEDLKSFLRGKLPDYMVPSFLVDLKTMPLTPNGKVDRKALSLVEPISCNRKCVGPRTSKEEILVALWKDVLNVQAVGIDDNFFDLGGHSLLATRLMSRIRKAFGVEMPLRSLFDTPTIREMAAGIEKARGLDLNAESPTLARKCRTGDIAVSYSQERMWLLDQMDPGSTAYHVTGVMRIKGDIQLEALEHSINQIIRRHEPLRTRFELRNTSVLQVIDSEQVLKVSVDDFENLEFADQQCRLREVEKEEGRPFDLARGPLLRVRLARLAAREHVLFVRMHHIVSDGWSMGVLVREFARFYEAFTSGKELALPDLPIQYADYALWQRQWLDGKLMDEQMKYWKGRINGFEPLELPTDSPRIAARSYQGAVLSVNLGKDLTRHLESVGRREGITLFMVLSAVFKVLLWRYTGQEDVAIGTPVANRNRAELEGLIGFFVNTLVLRTDLSGDPTVTELFEREREATLGAYEHQDVPFEKLVAQLSGERRSGRNPLFQVMLALQNAPVENLAVKGLELESMSLGRRTAKFDLTLVLQESENGLTGSIEYAADLFAEKTILHLIDHYTSLLEQIVKHPEKRISELELFREPERRKLLKEWNDTAREYPRDKHIYELFEEQVEKTPDAVAVSFEQQRMTYRGLNDRANRLAHALRQAGVGPDVVVPVLQERSFDLVVSLLAVLKAGGAYVPLDPIDPRTRVANAIEELNSPIILTRQKVFDILGDVGGMENAVNGPHVADTKREVCGENLAYVIYTSGSTGVPKGAMNTHAGIRNRLQWMQEAYQLTAVDAVLQKTPYTFDVSVWEFFWPLIVGARLVLARPGGHRDPDYLATLIEQEAVTTIHFVPSMLKAFLEEGSIRKCVSLKRVICSGEVLPVELAKQFHHQSNAELHNLYGPTEASVDVTFWFCAREDHGLRSVPIGKPIANLSVYILDQCMNPVPVGTMGEIYLGGVGLGRGYLKRPDMTATAFVPDPFSEGGRLYRTGDWGCFDQYGVIEFRGRRDQQVKIRGFRIELGEIENVLREHADVRDVTVVVNEGLPGEKRLFAYVVPRNPADLVLSEQLYQLPNGLKIAHCHKYETDLFYKEIFEEETYVKHGLTLPDGACVFDVGANIGMFTLFVAQHCRHPRIFAFEPSPAYQKLQANLALYGLDATAMSCGLSNERKTAPLRFYPGMTAMSGAYAEAAADEATSKAVLKNRQPELLAYAEGLFDGKFVMETLDCAFKTISDVIREERIERIDLLKIDAEKSEWDILSGIETDDWEKVRQIAIEVHDSNGELNRVTELLKGRGFEVFVAEETMFENTGLYNVYALRPGIGNGKQTRTVQPLTPVRQPGRLPAELRDYLKQKLPEYMLPAGLVLLEKLPVTANGKVDRRALPAPKPAVSVEARLPRTDFEQMIAGLWQEVLGFKVEDVDANFFDLGGHSLLLPKLSAGLSSRLEKTVSILDLLRYPTVAELAGHFAGETKPEQPQPLVTPARARNGVQARMKRMRSSETAAEEFPLPS